ncbi:hypothetical protein G9A89_000087 [Geosiphon pyriformis]|nr:hypothetical protein G9A89_000087 [Geosiphon pyriformis]
MFQLSLVAKIILISSIIHSIIGITIEAVLTKLKNEKPYANSGELEADLIYQIMFMFSLIFQIILVVDALWRRNSIQLVALVIFNLLSVGYAGLQIYRQERSEEEIIEINKKNEENEENEEMDTIEALEYSLISLNYKNYSADIRIRNAYKASNILQTLIKLDAFFILCYAVQLIPSRKLGYPESTTEIVLIFVIGFLMLVLAWYALRREQKYAMLVLNIILGGTTIYLTYRCVRVNIKRDPANDPYKFTRRSLTFSLTTTLLSVIATMAYAILCFRNFWRGTYVLTVFDMDCPDNIPTTGKISRRQMQQIQNRDSKQQKFQIAID